MTRKEELRKIAATALNEMMADGVQFSPGQFVVGQYCIVKALQQVEREVWDTARRRLSGTICIATK